MKDTVKENEETTDWEKIFAKHLTEKRLVSKIYKELLKLYSNNPIKNLTKDLNRHLTKVDGK